MTSAPNSPPSQRRLTAVLAPILGLGVLAGVLWAFLTPTAAARIVDDGMLGFGVGQTAEAFGAVGTFSLIAAVYGFVAALLLWFGARSWRRPAGVLAALAATVLGGFLAAAVGSLVVDQRFGDPTTMAVGTDFRYVPDLWLTGAGIGPLPAPWILLVVAPCMASLVLLIAVILAPGADLGVGDLPEDDAALLEPTDFGTLPSR